MAKTLIFHSKVADRGILRDGTAAERLIFFLGSVSECLAAFVALLKSSADLAELRIVESEDIIWRLCVTY